MVTAAVDRIRAAVARRADLDTPCVRLFDGAGDGIPRLVIERFGDAHRITGGPENQVLLPTVRAALERPEPLFWRFDHEHEGGPPGDDGAREVDEAGLRYGVRLRGSRNTGLFLDARPARAWVRAHAEGRRVLNLFSFTCTFGVAAAAGGARATTNVDNAAGALERGRQNYALNRLPADARTFWHSDVIGALQRARKSRARFDGIVLDPPPTAQGRRGGRRTEPDPEHLARLCAACRAVLDPGGWLLLLCASGRLTDDDLLRAADLGEPVWRGTSDDDFVASEGSPALRAWAFGA